jgi:hypothetical protein
MAMRHQLGVLAELGSYPFPFQLSEFVDNFSYQNIREKVTQLFRLKHCNLNYL